MLVFFLARMSSLRLFSLSFMLFSRYSLFVSRFFIFSWQFLRLLLRLSVTVSENRG